MMSINLRDIAILNISSADHHGITTRINKSEATNIMQNIDLSEKKRKIIICKNLLSHIKTGKEISTFSDIRIEKYKLFRYKSPIFQKIDLTRFLLAKKT